MDLQRGSIVRYEDGLNLQYSELSQADLCDVSLSLITKHTKNVVNLNEVQYGDYVEFVKTDKGMLIVNKILKIEKIIPI